MNIGLRRLRGSRRTAGLTAALLIAGGLNALGISPASADTSLSYDDCTAVTGNLVQDCGFEGASGGTDPSWALAPAGSGSDFYYGSPAHSGNNGASFGAVSDQPDVISQTLTGTVPGATYTVGFWYQVSGGGDNNLVATVSNTAAGSTTVLSDQNDPGASWQFVQTTFVATSTPAVLSFAGYNGPSFDNVDDVAVVRDGVAVAITPPSAVTYGATPTVTATESPAVAGSVQFSVNGTDFGSPVTVDGSGSATSPALTDGSGQPLTAGSYSIGATFTPTDTVQYTTAAAPPQTLTVNAAPTQTTLAAPTGVVYGQSTTVTASETPAVGGSMDFTVDGTDVGSVAVDGTGNATSGTISGLAVGSHDVQATFTPTDSTDYTTSTSTTQSLVVGQADTTTSKPTISTTSVSTTVAPVAPGAGDPTGTVTFYSDGTQIGTAPVGSGGVATLTYASRGTVTIAASYGGDTNFTASSNSTAVTNPTISAAVSSARPKTAYGWYSTPVTVTFTCGAGSQSLQSPCPAPATLSSSGAAQSVTRTILDTDGGIATVTVSPINIDRVAPRIAIVGVRNGATYDGAVPRISCRATTGVSGLTPSGCRVTTSRSGSRVFYTATATSKAGITTRVRGSINVETVFIAGVTLHNGYYPLVKGRIYDLRAYATGKVAPVFLYAAPLGATPGGGHAAMTPIGHGLWQIRVALNLTPYNKWVMAVRIGRTTYLVRVLLT